MLESFLKLAVIWPDPGRSWAAPKMITTDRSRQITQGTPPKKLGIHFCKEIR
jgi:hypothetical protein